MDDQDEQEAISNRFPSGPWGGFFEQSMPNAAGRYRMELVLTFCGGRVMGDGFDAVGDFLIFGSYDEDGADLSVVKRYVGAHSVEYDGRFDDGGRAVGFWTIPRFGAGGFAIWPMGLGSGETFSTSASVHV